VVKRPMPTQRGWPQLVTAGPILRRCEHDQICVWLATSRMATIVGYLWRGQDATNARPDPIQAIGAGTTTTLAFGRQLHLALVQITPLPDSSKSFPRGEVLAYDLLITVQGAQGASQWLTALIKDLNLAQWSVPTVLLQPDGGSLNLLHASCRKLHGPGTDALALASAVLRHSGDRPAERPTALMLTGDQIYADDVADDIAPYLYERAKDLIGGTEGIPWGVHRLLLNELSGSRYLIAQALFSPDNAGSSAGSTARNHLFGFGEFAAMYLLSWSETNWPDGTLSDDLERLRQCIPQVRVALANIPTYMLCDDHEVTDDWNIYRAWVERTQTTGIRRATSRRIIANGLAAYWAFQAWGNNPAIFAPDRYAPLIREVLDREHAAGASDTPVDTKQYEACLLDDSHWDFVAPTDPATVLIDSRTRRSFPADRSGTGPAALLSADGLKAFETTFSQLNSRSDHRVVVAATPVFGAKPIESKIEFAGGFSATFFDRETWHGDATCFEHLLQAIQRHLKGTCVILSGDVHYAFAVHAVYQSGADTSFFVQFTSSAAKNAPDGGQKFLLEELAKDALPAKEGQPGFLRRWIVPQTEKFAAGKTRSVLLPLSEPLPDFPLPFLWDTTNIGLLRVADDDIQMTFIANLSTWTTLHVKPGAQPDRDTRQYQAKNAPSPMD
jgi:hypothetical protein